MLLLGEESGPRHASGTYELKPGIQRELGPSLLSIYPARLYSLQPKMEKLYTVNKNKTRR